MNIKNKKLLYSITKDSRVPLKKLSKDLKISQQSCSYQIKSLEKRKIIKGYVTIVDPAKLGYINVIVGFDFIDFNKQKIADLVNHFKKHKSIVYIEKGEQGVDLLIEFCSKNLSAFNKIHTEILSHFKDIIKAKFVLPIIVKHEYYKSYFVKSEKRGSIVVCGDREVFPLSNKELNILHRFVEKPKTKIVDISRKTKIPAKTIVSIKKKLKQNKVIRRFSCILDYKELGIKREIIFLKLYPSFEEMNKLRQYSRQNRNIVELVKTIGKFQAIVFAEYLDNSGPLEELRNLINIEDYLVIKADEVIKKKYVPF